MAPQLVTSPATQAIVEQYCTQSCSVCTIALAVQIPIPTCSSYITHKRFVISIKRNYIYIYIERAQYTRFAILILRKNCMHATLNLYTSEKLFPLNLRTNVRIHTHSAGSIIATIEGCVGGLPATSVASSSSTTAESKTTLKK